MEKRILGAVFGNNYSHEDYGAVMNYARTAPPAVKTTYVDIAGGDSAIDLTEAVGGGIAYEDGSIEFKFTLISREDASRMKNDLHGRRMEIILEREPDYIYTGRVSCTKEDHVSFHELYFTARVKPYKVERAETVHEEILMGREKEILLQSDTMPVIPRILTEGNIVLVYGGIRYRLEPGEYRIPEITLREGLNRIRLSGTGKIRFEYKRGRLI